MDVVSQNGLLSTPFQRVYFSDFEDFYIDDFQLADNVEQLPDSRFKIPVGGRLNYYLNDLVVLRSYYRFIGTIGEFVPIPQVWKHLLS